MPLAKRETLTLKNSTAIIWHTGTHYRARLEIDHETQKTLSMEKGTLNLSVKGKTIDEAKESAQRADAILGNMKAKAGK